MNDNLNYARIVYRLLTNPRGWRIDDLRDHLNITERTYRKYRLRLQDHFEPLMRRDGSSMVQEVTDGSSKYLRILDLPELGWSDDDFVARVAALYFSARLLSFVQGTEIGAAIESFLHDFHHSMRDRKTLLRDVLHNAERMFYEIPDAPKDYSDKDDVVRTFLKAVLMTRRVAVTYNSASRSRPWDLVLEPYTLASHRSALYLIAKTDAYDDIRIYAIDRFLKAELTDQKFDYPSSVRYDPAEYISGSWGLFRGDGNERHEFELVFDDKRWLKMFLQERRWHESQEFEELDDGRLRMTFTVTSDREVWPWIRGFGGDVEVRKPAEPTA